MLRSLLVCLAVAGQAQAASSAQPLPLLFVDDATIQSWDTSLTQRVHPPVKGPQVVSVDKPWESWAVFAYNHVMEVPPAWSVAGDRYRLYYDCIEGTGLPPGASNSLDATTHRRICLAISNDGLVWSKPSLGLFNRNGSTVNNILLEDSGVSVFMDGSAAAKASGLLWKMICSQGAYSSPDGLKWTALPFKSWPIMDPDDTKPTAYWDNVLDKYVISVRRDLTPDWYRTIGRCVTSNLSDWKSELNASESGCPVVFALDSQDPVCHSTGNCPGGMDIYTSAWTPYPSPESPAVHLFFPSMYYHFGTSKPFGFGNDGLLDIRLVVSRDGEHLHYAGPRAANARSPFVSLGINECGPGASAPDSVGGWCSPTTVLEKTSFDTSVTYMASGHLLSPDGNSVYMYSSGQPFSHGGDGGKQTWGNNTGIRVLSLRRDGFVSVDAPYDFSGGANNSKYPQMTTVPVTVPALPCPAGLNVTAAVNLVSSVAGFVAVSVEQGGVEVAGFGLQSASRLKGNALSAKPTWGGGGGSLDSLVGKDVSFRVAMADSSLYSIDFQCA